MNFGEEWAATVRQSTQQQYRALTKKLKDPTAAPFWQLLRSITVGASPPRGTALFGYTDMNQVAVQFLWLYTSQVVVEVFKKEFSIQAVQSLQDLSWTLTPIAALPPSKQRQQQKKEVNTYFGPLETTTNASSDQ